MGKEDDDVDQITLTLNSTQATELTDLITERLTTLIAIEDCAQLEIFTSILIDLTTPKTIISEIEKPVEKVLYRSYCYVCRCETDTTNENHENYCKDCDAVK